MYRAAFWSLANVPAGPKIAIINDSILSKDSRFHKGKEQRNTNRRLRGGLETHKRSTAGTCHPRGFGATATIQVSQDKVIFGICAVGGNGLKGPAMLPFLSFPQQVNTA